MSFLRSLVFLVFNTEYRRRWRIRLIEGRLQRVKIRILEIKHQNRRFKEMRSIPENDIRKNDIYIGSLRKKKSALKEKLAKLQPKSA